MDKRIASFLWRIENLIMDGGYSLITGHCGTGKSAALRIIANHLDQMNELKVGVLTRPQSGLGDFYRELGYLFEIDFRVSNRWGGYKALREKWTTHIQSTLFRPVLIIDEAQEMLTMTLNELRFLTSDHFDSKSILTVILCGDPRIEERLKTPDLLPLLSRIKTKLVMTPPAKEDLVKYVQTIISRAGSEVLLTEGLISAVVDHSMGNYRSLMNMCNELLMEGIVQKAECLDESLFFKTFDQIQSRQRRK